MPLFDLPQTQEEARQQWKSLTPSGGPVIGIAASHTADPITPYLGSALNELTGAAPEIIIGPYDQIEQICENPVGAFGKNPDILIILWRFEDIDSARVLSALKTLRKNFKGAVMISAPPAPFTPECSAGNILSGAENLQLHMDHLSNFQSQARQENALLLNVSGLMNEHGAHAAHDVRKWALYKQPYTEKFWHIIGHHAARLIAARTKPSKKCIVVDADNTLWGGIIGEDGIGGIDLGDDFPGSAFRDFQKQLKHYAQTGIFLALASKNNPEDVDQVFQKHDAMVLLKDDISVFEVHWDSKAESLKRIAEKLNIGLDALVFIDDNPKEVGEIKQRLPDVTCLLAPEEIEELPWIFSGAPYFDRLSLSEEDALRVQSAKAETAREELKETASEEDFLSALDLRVDVFKAQEQHLGRITQLMNKTNQFNLTTRRHTAEEVREIFNAPDYLLTCMKVSDKFGEYGLVGVCVLKIENETAVIDTLLMSCRALGRKAETAFLSAIAQTAQQAGAKTLSGAYLPTPKNKLVETLYKDHGFTLEGDIWSFDLSGKIDVPDYVNLNVGAA